ncbi:hypothetical protein Tco_0889156, partial [Tanacetum coccineum]
TSNTHQPSPTLQVRQPHSDRQAPLPSGSGACTTANNGGRQTSDPQRTRSGRQNSDATFKESMALIKAPPYTQLECIIIYYKYQMKQWKVAAFIQFYENGIEDESGSEFRGDTYEEKEERLLLGNIEQERE